MNIPEPSVINGSSGGRDPRGNLVAGMKWFLGACTGPFHRKIPAPVNSLPWTAIVQPPLLNSMARSSAVALLNSMPKMAGAAGIFEFHRPHGSGVRFWTVIIITGTAANR
jgi:hypothetical protein